MTTPTTESNVKADQLQRRIAWLSDENGTLRDLADPSAGTVRLQAENILLQRESQMLRELVPSVVPYAGPMPDTLDTLGALPAPHRRQLEREHPEHVLKLRQVDRLLRQADLRDEPTTPIDLRDQGYL